MRSVKKYRTRVYRKNRTGINLSDSQIIDLANTGVDVIKSGFDWFKEIEKTKQIAIEAQVRIAESNNRLASDLAEFEKEMFRIQKEYELEFKKLDDEFKFKNRQLDLIEKLIDKIDKIEIEIKIYQERDGLTSQSVMTLFEQLHQQKMSFIDHLVQLGKN